MESVDTGLVRRSKDSGICFVLLDPSRDRSNLVFPNANDEIDLPDLDLAQLKETRFMHLTSFVGDRPLRAQRKLVAELPSRVKVSFDPGEIYARRNLRELLPIIRRSTIVFLTDKEIMLLTGKSWREGVKELLNYGPSIIACKRGLEGSYVLTKDIELDIHPDKVKVVDTTGAGDVFAAGFLAGMLLGRPLYDCARFASKAAAQSVTGYGREKYPDKAFLNRFFGLSSSMKDNTD
jgi:ribokinase